MATLVLSTVGTVIGGPFGQALGALIGNQIDRAIFSPGGSREGARLKELAFTTSSYGQPMPRQFGRMRVAGSVIWATDIRESSTREGGGKTQPSVTTYSYSASFAVALSSTPLARIGRIWADGNLLRGAAGDLKVEGAMRLHLGNGNEAVDPLIAADKGANAPAFRDYAYVVFEDLALADFGNRIPALTFEIFATEEESVALRKIVPDALGLATSGVLDHARGFADEGGAVAHSLAAIDQVLPLSCVTTADGVSIQPVDRIDGDVRILPERLATIDDAETRERPSQRAQAGDTVPLALRYYDEDRDYQPGVQRAVGLRPNGLEMVADLPATMTATGARQLANENAQRSRWRRETMTWRTGALDPNLKPGSLVSAPGVAGIWRVTGWEWYDRGIELELERVPPQSGLAMATDPGAAIAPVDLPVPPTILDFFEVPPEFPATPSACIMFAAASAQTQGWRGAALFAEQGDTLTRIGSALPIRAVTGHLVEPLESSSALLFAPAASMTVELAGAGLELEPTDLSGLALGKNRLLVGGEVIQFADAAPVAERTWQLTGLLRGRAGTEDFAALGHPAHVPIALLDDRMTPLDTVDPALQTANRIAAVGRGDSQPVYADLRNRGLSRRPPMPVHPRIAISDNGDWEIAWTRRARGAWLWLDAVETALVEESESYVVGYGDITAPPVTWTVPKARIAFTEAERSALVTQHGASDLWVRQTGTYASSPALLLTRLT